MNYANKLSFERDGTRWNCDDTVRLSANASGKNDPDSQARLENLEEFLSVTKEFDAKYQPDDPEAIDPMTDFLGTTALMSDLDDFEEGDGAVTLMTLHAAKGLEFPVVFLVGMEEGIFPLSRSMMDDDQLEEERRLAYVGITRAMKKVVLNKRLFTITLWSYTI